jgi:GTP-binding protein
MAMRKQVGALSFVGSFPRDWPDLDLPEVAFAGRSNVGKSSALNTLLNSRKAARVSGRPGRTQAINLFKVGNACIFADLPGYGFAKVPAAVQSHWKTMIESYLAERETLRMVILLVDARRKPQEMDGMLHYALTESDIPSLVVATKVDKLKKQQLQRNLRAIAKEFNLPAGQPVPFSSHNGTGRDAVWTHIETACR